MKVLDAHSAFELLTQLPIIRVAVFDQERAAMYAVPLAFVAAPDEQALTVAINAEGRLAQALQAQSSGICVEADEVRADLSYRSVIGTATATPLAAALPTLTALAQRYGQDWPCWRPHEPTLAVQLRFISLQGRSTL